MRRVGAIAVVLALLALGAAGCGGGSAGTGSGGTTERSAHTPSSSTSPSRPLAPGEHPPAARAPADRSIELGSLQLAGPHAAWALGAGGLLWTSDEGRHWRRITPPALGERLGEALFLNAKDGWATSGLSETQAPIAIDLTRDGGRHWTRGKIAGDPEPLDVAGIALSFPDREHGFAEVRPIVSGAITGAPLYATSDDGRHWRFRGEAPVEGELEFTSRRRGWALSGMLASEYFTTGDGGRHWTRVRLPLPPWAKRERATYGLPIRVDGRLVLPMNLEDRGERTHIALYAESAHGWKLIYSLKLKGLIGGSPDGSVVAVPPDGLVIHDPGAQHLILVTFHGDRPTATSLAARGLNGGGVDFADRRHGASLPCFECDGGKLPYWTDDGGERWVRRPVHLTGPAGVEGGRGG